MDVIVRHLPASLPIPGKELVQDGGDVLGFAGGDLVADLLTEFLVEPLDGGEGGQANV